VTAGDVKATVAADGTALTVEAGHAGTPTSRVVAQPAALWSLWTGKADGKKLYADALLTTDGMEELRWLVGVAKEPLKELEKEIEARGAGLNRALLGKIYHGEPIIVTHAVALAFAEASNDTNPAFTDTKRPGGVMAPPMLPVKYCNQIYFQVFQDPALRVDFARLLFGEMDMRFVAPIRPRDLIVAKGQVISIEDKDTGQVLTVRTRILCEGEVKCEATAAFFVRFKGKGRIKPLKGKEGGAKEAEPKVAFEDQMLIQDDQTNRFAKAADDPNPIHVDDAFAKSVGLPGRILHGVCSMTFTGEAFVNQACGGDPEKLRRLKVRFSKPALPGQTITTRAYAPEVSAGAKVYKFVAMTSPTDLIITGGEAEVRA
jgi:acyl dehydratase